MKIFKCSIMRVLLLFVIAVIFAGCSSKPAVSRSGEAANTDTVPLKFLFITYYNNNPSYEDVLREIEKKTKGSLNIKLNFEFYNPGSEGAVKGIETRLKSGEQIDAFGTAMYWLKELKSKELVMDITKHYEKYADSLSRLYNGEDLKGVRIDGRLYGLPNVMPSSSRRKCVIVRGDLMEKYKIPDIKTLDDFEFYLKTIHENEKDLIMPGFSYLNLEHWFIEAYGYTSPEPTFVARLDDPEMKLIPWEQTPEYKLAAQRVRDWYKNGYISEIGRMQQMNPHNIEEFSGAFGILYRYEDIIRNTAGTPDGPYKKVYPLYPDIPVPMELPMNRGGIAVSSSSRHPERVIRFMDWVQEKQENYDLLVYGIKNRNYRLKNGKIEPLVKEDEFVPYCRLWSETGPDGFLNVNFQRPFFSQPVDFWKDYKRVLERQNATSLQARRNKLAMKAVAAGEKFPERDKSYSEFWKKRYDAFRELEQSLGEDDFNIKVDEFIEKQKQEGLENQLASLNNFWSEVDRILEKYK